MKVRKMDADGDFIFGRSNEYFKDSPEGVAQCVSTRLQLWTGQWFLDVTEGTQWLPKGVLGKQSLADTIIQSRIRGTPGVRDITEYEAVLDTNIRKLKITAKIDTTYGASSVSEAL